MAGASRIVNAPSANGIRHAWRPMSASGSVITENEKPKPPASASIEVAYARAPSGASSTTATLATVAVMMRNARWNTCAAVKNTRFGEKAEMPHDDRRADDRR